MGKNLIINDENVLKGNRKYMEVPTSGKGS